jgi:hypothetical protein
VVNQLCWCRVYFFDSKKGKSVFLGADALKIICNRICSALKRENINEKEMEKHEGYDIFWILSLAEQHAAIHGSLTDNFGIKLFCVEDGTPPTFFPEINLERQDVENWISTLEETIVTLMLHSN